MTDKEIDRIIKANIKMAGFVSLVKRMREAQKDANRAMAESDDYPRLSSISTRQMNWRKRLMNT